MTIGDDIRAANALERGALTPVELTATDTAFVTWYTHAGVERASVERATFPTPDDLDPDGYAVPRSPITEGGDVIP